MSGDCSHTHSLKIRLLNGERDTQLPAITPPHHHHAHLGPYPAHATPQADEAAPHSRPAPPPPHSSTCKRKPPQRRRALAEAASESSPVSDPAASVVPYPHQNVVPPGGRYHPAERRKTLQIRAASSWGHVVDAYVDTMATYVTVNRRDLL